MFISTTAWKATKTKHLPPQKIRQVQVTEQGDYKRKTHFCNWFLQEICESFDPLTQNVQFSLMKPQWLHEQLDPYFPKTLLIQNNFSLTFFDPFLKASHKKQRNMVTS
jgi:hypothetical protein